MNSLSDIPEIRSLINPVSSVRIPGELNVPLTDRIRGLIETASFQRLRQVSQLGLVSLVYPGATHSRFEHSLGVYRLALLFVSRLAQDPAFARAVTAREALAFLVAALVHDIGHWPFCHPLEDLRLDELPRHEQLARQIFADDEFAARLAKDFELTPDDLGALVGGTARTAGERLLCSLLSSPIDVDKMDYLFRDSLHAGVPYGRNFDGQRLIDSLCVGRDGASLAIGDKGRTAAEMLVFARYIMFSEVYWHHAVRAATAMLQRAFFELRERLNVDRLQRSTDSQFIEQLRIASRGEAAEPLVDGLFGPRRTLFKRWLEFNSREHGALYRRFARQPYSELRRASEALAAELSRRCGAAVDGQSILIDAPPAHLEIQFNLDVRRSAGGEFRTLAELSPVVEALARQQFDDLVKRVRVFVAPHLVEPLSGVGDRAEVLVRCVGA